MTVLVWDQIGDRFYESGIDRGVLFLVDGTAIPWSGLTSVSETSTKQSSPTYFDGRKIQDSVTVGDSTAVMKAITYPDEFTELEGYGFFKNGVFVGDQPPKVFDLSYRTRIGNDLDPDLGYKIHIVYNVTAIPKDKSYETLSDSPSVTEFEWDIFAVPEEVDGFRPTAHVIFDTTKANSGLITAVEEMLYGSVSENPSLLPMSELLPFLDNWSDIQIVDNGDGTWTLTTALDNVVSVDGSGEFTLNNVDADFIDANTYTLSNS